MDNALAKLPRVDRVAAHTILDMVRDRLGAAAITVLARRVIDEARQSVRDGGDCPSLDAAAHAVERLANEALSARVRPVINATGIVLHTNLGRAPLGASAVAALAATSGRYASVEIDLTSGRRGGRAAFAERSLAGLASAEDALLVNNCAAAVLLALTSIAFGKSVLVSRGELVEIGGGFRIPEVLQCSGARLVEVGTTNRTHLADYARALDETQDAAAILRVHQGNFRQTGFVERPSLAALAELARVRGVPFIKDLGGGALVDLSEYGLKGEPLVRDAISAGVDLVCFSTDKALGGPQGGAIVGRRDLVASARRHPLARAVRIGRLPLVALEATISAYIEGDLDAVPALARVRTPIDRVRDRAEAWRQSLGHQGIEAELIETGVEMGGGTLADVRLASIALGFTLPDPDRIATALRAGDPAVLCRIHEGKLLIDARTVLPAEDEELLIALARAFFSEGLTVSGSRVRGRLR